ncbi:hypothetical protein Cni_G09290 [Canna indica]|uniref:Uncharacterized protein n=1 Tax=Canna indica TaxID=4628 RepID=A0AAQ3K286_9LILI|nr:hypothetical protein Cni_G09290 [Canna indica]
MPYCHCHAALISTFKYSSLGSETKPTSLYINTPPAMGKVIRTIRSSFHAFFKSYQAFASIAALLLFPVSAAILLSQSTNLSSSPVLQAISSRLAYLFEAAGLPPSRFFTLLNFKISQTIFTFVSTLPFTSTLLVIAKATVSKIIHGIPCRNAILASLFLVFNALDILHVSSNNSVILALSSGGVILYSFVLANAMVTCNLSIIISAVDGIGGYLPILKALVLVRGRTATAMTLGLPASLGLAAIEALFQYRVIKPYRRSARFHPSVIWEAFLIIYMYSFVVVFDTIITCIFLKSCKCSTVQSSWNKYSHKSEEKAALQV